MARTCPKNAEYGRPAPTIKAQGNEPKEPETKKDVEGIIEALQDQGMRQEVFDRIIDAGFV